jgi:hypothetical protein
VSRCKNERIYSFKIEKNSAEASEMVKKNTPSIGADDLHKSYHFWTLGVSIHARFKANQLTYLKVCMCESC